MTRSAGGLDRGVCVVAEQLRRAVPGGIGTYARGLIAGLAAREAAGGSRVPLTCYASRAPAGGDPLARLGVPVQASGLPGPVAVRAWAAGLGARGGPYALVHATSFAFPGGRAPLVGTVHDLCWRQFPEAYPPRGRAWHEAALARLSRRARMVVVPSTAVAGALLEARTGLGEDQVAVVEEGSDHLAAPDDAAAADRLSGLGVTGPFLLAVGTREPRKNLGRLLAAYARARTELPEPWPLVVVGPAGWGEEVVATDGVVLAGKVTDGVLAALYARARCCAYVPLAEGFGLPVVEAMRAGTPVVASDVPSAGGATWQVDPRDLDDLAAGLVAAASDEAVRARLVAAGRARVAGLTWQRCAERHVGLWAAVTGA